MRLPKELVFVSGDDRDPRVSTNDLLTCFRCRLAAEINQEINYDADGYHVLMPKFVMYFINVAICEP